MEPFADLIDTLYALIRIMEEESETLALSGPTSAIAELAQAKVRLAARMEQICARLHRHSATWMEDLQGEERAQFAEATEELHKAATVNSDILERQIALSTDMLSAVGLELERISGRSGTTYGRLGDIRRKQATLPLSVNQRY